MDDFTKKQITECESNINGINELLKIEKAKSNPDANKILKWENTLAQQQGILKGLKGDKPH